MAERKKKLIWKQVSLQYAVCLLMILAGIFAVLMIKPYISKAAQEESGTEQDAAFEAVLTASDSSVQSEPDILYQYKEGFYYQKISKNIKKRMMGKSYRKNSDIKLSDLRYLRVLHYNFKGKVKSGEIVVNKSIAKKTLMLFYELYEIKYPIQCMKLIDDYDADDVTSMENNNTSCFCYRKVDGKKILSKHALGKAIDINPRINPYVYQDYVSPSNGKKYRERTVKKCRGRYRKYMIHKGDQVYNIFMKYGFTTWGGNWNYEKDYQHFQTE
jgi:hypothetical protein